MSNVEGIYLFVEFAKMFKYSRELYFDLPFPKISPCQLRLGFSWRLVQRARLGRTRLHLRSLQVPREERRRRRQRFQCHPLCQWVIAMLVDEAYYHH